MEPQGSEKVAHLMYDEFCAAVGGTSFDGAPLLKSAELFGDPTKEKQANAWRQIAKTVFTEMVKPGSFGWAVEHAKAGKKVSRSGWNGSGMYATIMPGYPDGVEVNEATQKAHNLPAGTKLVYRPYWQLFTAQKDIAMWAPSGSDSLAEDWTIVE